MEERKSLVFFGTHNWALSVLTALFDSNNYDIQAVVTQPDKAAGRDHELYLPPIKRFAVEHGFPVLQPETLQPLKSGLKESMQADFFVVCEYSLLIPKIILNIPRFGTINLHSSVLPKYRGATPVQSALINGERETGVTVMLVDAKMDHGDILAQEKLVILPHDTYPAFMTRLAPVANKLLLATLPRYFEGTIKPVQQNHSEATFCKKFTRDDGRVNWAQSAEQVYNLYRGLYPWPGIWTMLNNKRLKLLKVARAVQNIPSGQLRIIDDRVFIGCDQGSIEVLELQLEGKKMMSGREFAHGYKKFDLAVLN